MFVFLFGFMVCNFREIFLHLFSYDDYLSCVALSLIPMIGFVFCHLMTAIVMDTIWLIRRGKGKREHFTVIKGISIFQKWCFRLVWIFLILALCLDDYYRGSVTSIIILFTFFIVFSCFLLGMIYWNKKIKEKENKIIIRYVSIVGSILLVVSFGMGLLANSKTAEEVDNWTAPVTIKDLLGEGKTEKQNRRESPVLEILTYEGKSGRTFISYTIYRSR